jgi:outer membrane protein assembly factor BamB
MIRHRLIALAFIVLPATLRAGDDSAAAKAIVEASGIRTGLCIHLGCGRTESPALTAALAENSEMLVHGLALDDAALERTRAAIDARGVAGRALAEKLVEKSLPYLPDLARLAVVEDLNALAASGISKEELMRVLCPGGALCVKASDKWTVTVKARPKEMDEWTHPHHGPDENMASNDKAFTFPISLRWIDGLPNNRGGFGECAATRAVVLAGGRCFTISVEDLGNGPAQKQSAYLMARDAFCGLPLWKLSCEGSYGRVELDWRNVWPLVATDKKAYTARGNEVLLIDAATGKIETTCPTKYQPRRLVLLDKTLIAACWEKTEDSHAKDGFENDDIRGVWWPAGGGSVEAFDPETGKPRWSLPLTALTLAASDGTAYLMTQKGNPPTERDLVAVDLATGKEKWHLPYTTFGEEPDTALNFAGPNCVVISKTKSKSKRGVFVLNAADGKVLYSIPNTIARCIIGNELWCTDNRYDLKTGKSVPGCGLGATYAGTNVIGGCIPPIVVGGHYITGSRGCSYLELPENVAKPPAKLTYLAARGACIQGMVPANGMLYTAQNNCACIGAQVGGFLGIGPSGDSPKADEFQKPRPVEKGPAFGAVEAPSAASDWPAYRHDAQRSAGANGKVPESLQVLWKMPLAKAGEGAFADAWNSRIGSPQPLTAPIVAAGMVVVAGFNSGQVMALAPDSGKKIWTATLAGRIDSPPTYHNGLLLVGCHDGWVYALRGKDGALAYRVRIAPRERRMVAHGSVESVWPATGAVLVHDGIAYATAGRSSEADGGIALVAFKPESGETVWSKNFGEGSGLMIDILSIQNGELAWHSLRLDPKTGNPLAPAQKFYGNVSMIDGAWTNGFNKRSGGGFSLGKMSSNLMAWNEQFVLIPGLAANRPKIEAPKPEKPAGPKHPDALKPEEIAWRFELEPHIEWARIYSMTLTENSALLAGSVFNGWANGKYDGSFIWVKSTADGKSRQPPIALESPPSYDSIAASNGRVYIALQNGSLVCLGK